MDVLKSTGVVLLSVSIFYAQSVAGKTVDKRPPLKKNKTKQNKTNRIQRRTHEQSWYAGTTETAW